MALCLCYQVLQRDGLKQEERDGDWRRSLNQMVVIAGGHKKRVLDFEKRHESETIYRGKN